MNLDRYNNDKLIFKRFAYFDYPDHKPYLCNKGDRTKFQIKETSQFDNKNGEKEDK